MKERIYKIGHVTIHLHDDRRVEKGQVRDRAPSKRRPRRLGRFRCVGIPEKIPS